MASPNAPVTTTPASFSQLATVAIPFIPGVLNAQHEYHAALESVRDAVVEAIWQADGDNYISVTDSLPGFTGASYGDVRAHVARMLDEGKFAELDAIMERIDQAESDYDPDEDESEEADENDGE